MIINEKPINFYLSRLRKGQYFCFPGYSDAEFYCMMKLRLNTKTGLGQKIDAKTGDALLDVMIRRQHDKRWFFAIPKILTQLPLFTRYDVDKFLVQNGINIEGYERDSVLDDRARDAGLFPLIYQFQQMDTVLIGPQEFASPELGFLDYKEFFPIESPNLHLSKTGISDVVDKIKSKKFNNVCYLVSAGVSAPLIIDRLYNSNPDNFYLDCGSIWDAFVGIGGQRQWRADLYENTELLEAWKRKNINGTY